MCLQSNNHLTDIGAEAVCAALHCNTSLQDLSLRGNFVTDRGVGAMLTALGFNAALICVDMSETQCSERARALLAELILAK